jgi:hypothetical protein
MPMRHLAARTLFPFRLYAEQSLLTPLLRDALPLAAHVPGLAPAVIASVHHAPDSISLLAIPGLLCIIIRVPAAVTDDEALSERFRSPILCRCLRGLARRGPDARYL